LLTADFIHEKSWFRHVHTSFYCKTFILSPHRHCFSATQFIPEKLDLVSH